LIRHLADISKHKAHLRRVLLWLDYFAPICKQSGRQGQPHGATKQTLNSQTTQLLRSVLHTQSNNARASGSLKLTVRRAIRQHACCAAPGFSKYDTRQQLHPHVQLQEILSVPHAPAAGVRRSLASKGYDCPLRSIHPNQVALHNIVCVVTHLAKVDHPNIPTLTPRKAPTLLLAASWRPRLSTCRVGKLPANVAPLCTIVFNRCCPLVQRVCSIVPRVG
jgi:hypothetical protein